MDVVVILYMVAEQVSYLVGFVKEMMVIVNGNVLVLATCENVETRNIGKEAMDEMIFVEIGIKVKVIIMVIVVFS